MTRNDRRWLCVSTPYRENSIAATARVAAADGTLDRFFTTFHFASLQGAARRVPLIGLRLANGLGRRAFSGIPPGSVRLAGSSAELIHVAARRMFGRRLLSVSDALMYRVKVRFDRAVASQLRCEPSSVLAAMYGAGLESFQEIHRHGGLAVLNFVNSHPTEHNRYLLELAGCDPSHHELIPAWMMRRVEAELAVADLVLVPSRFVERQLLGHGVPASKIAVLPYGADLSRFTPADARSPDREMLECLYVGQISHRKGVPVLLDAAQRCTHLPVHFRLIGPLVSPEVLCKSPLNVEYAGATLPGGVAEAMRAADLFVLPTLEDSFGLVVLEAMATGLAVVTTTKCGAAELMCSEEDGLVVPAGDAVALADAIRRLVEDRELRRRLGRAARHMVERAHSWDAYGQSVLAAIAARERELRIPQGKPVLDSA